MTAKVFSWLRYMLYVFILFAPFNYSCGGGEPSGTWVEPSIDSRGRYRKGHYRKDISTDYKAEKSRSRSRSYYHSTGKLRRKIRKK